MSDDDLKKKLEISRDIAWNIWFVIIFWDPDRSRLLKVASYVILWYEAELETSLPTFEKRIVRNIFENCWRQCQICDRDLNVFAPQNDFFIMAWSQSLQNVVQWHLAGINRPETGPWVSVDHQIPESVSYGDILLNWFKLIEQKHIDMNRKDGI
jgi:hypothetical protein